MVALTWDDTTKHFFQHGVSKGVLQVHGGTNVPWNGLVSVADEPAGGEHTPLFFDGHKYFDHVGRTSPQHTVECIMYPEEFNECLGLDGINTEQIRKRFNFAYRTEIGNAAAGEEVAYELHLVYNATVLPATKTHQTTSEAAQLSTFSYTFVSAQDPIEGVNVRPTSHIILDSRLYPTTVAIVEEQIYDDGVGGGPGTFPYGGIFPPIKDVLVLTYDDGGEPPVELDRHDHSVMADDPLAFYYMDELVRDTVLDYSGNERNSIMVGGDEELGLGAASLLEGVTDDHSIQFPGSLSSSFGPGIRVPDDAWIDTVKAWDMRIRFNSFSGTRSLMTRDDDAGANRMFWFFLGFSGSNVRLGLAWWNAGGGGPFFISGGVNLLPGTDYTLGASLDSAGVWRTYVNGEVDATSASGQTLRQGARDIMIGANTASTTVRYNLYAGKMSRLAFYGTALPTDRFLAHHNAAIDA